MIKISLNFKNVLNHKNIIRKITKVKDHPPKDCDRTCLRKNPNMGVILKYHIFSSLHTFYFIVEAQFCRIINIGNHV